MRFLFVSLLIVNSQFAYGLEKINTTLYNYAKACPETSSKKIQSLVSYLSKGGNSQNQRVELFCYWIAENISYDTHCYLTGNCSPTSTILDTKKGVCQNYSELLQDMCELLGIECHVVVGYAKGYGYTKDKVFQDPNHAWNIVKVDGKYAFIDVTWASGNVQTIKGKMSFTKKLNIAELFANSEYFLSKHLPADPRWQMRNNPITLKSFSSNDSVNVMLKSTITNYNYQDSVSFYLKADSLDRRIITAESRYTFNPVKENLIHLGDSYYYKAWTLSNRFKNTVANQQSSILFYDKAIAIYLKLNNSYCKKWIEMAKKGIVYSNSQIDLLKEDD